MSKHVTTCRNTLQSVQTCWNTFPADDVFFYFLFSILYLRKIQPFFNWWSTVLGEYFQIKINIKIIHPPPPPSPSSPLLPLFPFLFFGGGEGEGEGGGGRGGKPPPPKNPGRGGGDEVPPPPPQDFKQQQQQKTKLSHTLSSLCCVIYPSYPPKGFSLSVHCCCCCCCCSKLHKHLWRRPLNKKQNSLWHTSIFIFIYIYYISPPQ